MTSINPDINRLHEAFCKAAEVELPLNPVRERWWYDANKLGLKPQDVTCAVRHRKDRIKAGVRHPESLMLRNICGSEEAISDVMEEAAMIRALSRKTVYSPGKTAVLKATGRSGEPPEQPVKTSSEAILNLAAEMRKAAS